jgi:hypothetical protein
MVDGGSWISAVLPEQSKGWFPGVWRKIRVFQGDDGDCGKAT